MTEYSVRKNRILVVDDEPDIVESLKHFFSTKGYEVSGALSAEEALSILDAEKTDLILLDIKMPGIQGTEMARIVTERYPETKIIIITGYPNEADNLSKSNLWAGLFVKPIQPQELHKRILEVLRPPEIEKALLWVKTMILLAMLNILLQNHRDN